MRPPDPHLLALADVRARLPAAAAPGRPVRERGTSVHASPLDDYLIRPQELRVPEGQAPDRHACTNRGRLGHTVPDPRRGPTNVVTARRSSRGEQDRRRLKLAKGTYTMYCALANHEELGMYGTAGGRLMKIVEPQRFRDVMGHFATGVTVGDGERRRRPASGMTANAVCSLSLDPLLLLVLLRQRRAHAARVVAEQARSASTSLGWPGGSGAPVRLQDARRPRSSPTCNTPCTRAFPVIEGDARRVGLHAAAS